MTPDEVAAAGNGRLQEYIDGRRALAVLQAELAECGEDMVKLGNALRKNKPLPNIDRALERLAAFETKLEDYRATRKRCAGLYQLLGHLGLTEAIKDLSDFQRF